MEQVIIMMTKKKILIVQLVKVIQLTQTPQIHQKMIQVQQMKHQVIK